MNLSINPSILSGANPSNSPAIDGRTLTGGTAVICPHCSADIPANAEWGDCPYCQKWLQIRVWPIVRQNPGASATLGDQATCFFHPEKSFQACCHRCGRFVCALCDLQLGAEHICPTCFERGRVGSSGGGENAEWRYRDVLYDSIAVTLGWGWILIWPSIIAAVPVVIFLHVKFRKAPRSYLVPRAGWRFWVAYVGFIWVPLLLTISFWMPARR